MIKELDVLGTFARDRDNLIPIFQAEQAKSGYLSAEFMESVADYLGISLSSTCGVATFYTQFKFSRPGDHKVKVCLGTACYVRGGTKICDEVSHQLKIQAGEVTPDYKFSLEGVACFGSCAQSPVVVVDRKVYGKMNAKKVKNVLKEYA